MSNADLREARTAIVRLLHAVEQGDLDASTPTERRLRRRLEGALSALDAALGDQPGATMPGAAEDDS